MLVNAVGGSEEPAASISRYKMEAAGSSVTFVTTYKPK
jgi:hypothetical protein